MATHTSRLMAFLCCVLCAAGLLAQPSVGWNYTLNGDADGDDLIGIGNVIQGNESMIVADDGYIYVTGSTDGVARDCLTIKIDPLGNEVWRATYSTAGNNGGYAIQVADSGNVYVAGILSPIGVSDILLLKYDSDGNQVWAANYPSAIGGDLAYDLEIDDQENIYVVGQVLGASGNDLILLKYDSDGILDPAWGGPATYDSGAADFGYSLQLDGMGSVYCVGYTGPFPATDALLVKFDTATGNEVWSRAFNPGTSDFGFTLRLDSAGNPIICGQTQRTSVDGFVKRYLADGTPDWEYFVDPNGEQDEVYHIEVDAADNVYGVGRSDDMNSRNLLTFKLMPDGTEEWARYYDSGVRDQGYDLAVDAMGQVYVCGRTGTDPQFDYVTIKYASDGTEEWVHTFDGGDRDEPYVIDLLENTTTNPIVGGRSSNANANYDFTILRIIEGVAPTANADMYSPREDEVLSVTAAAGVISNDNEPDAGQTLRVVDYDATSVEGASVVMSEDGSFSYTPLPEFFGIDSFTYTIDDDNLGVSSATVVIDVLPVNDQPTLRGKLCVELLANSGGHTFAGWVDFTRYGPENEAMQTPSFEITNNSNPSLFAAGPAIDAFGVLTLTLADGATGEAELDVVFRDDGGTANGGLDSSDPITLIVIVSEVILPEEPAPAASSKSGGDSGCTIGGRSSFGHYALLLCGVLLCAAQVCRRDA